MPLIEALRATSRVPVIRGPSTVYWFVTFIWAVLLMLRVLAPADLMDKAQQQMAAYVQDIAHNGNWICPRDDLGRITSKPPLYSWLAALAAIPFGRASSLTLYVPCALAMLVNVWLIVSCGSRYFGARAGMIGSLCYLLSFTGAQQILLARTDTLFTLTVFGAALCAFRAWNDGCNRTWFWILVAAATLTKGPLGLLLASGGTAAAWWERRTGAQMSKFSLRSHLIGFYLFMAITLGWFLLAWRQNGIELWNKMVEDELVGHAFWRGDAVPLMEWYKPLLHFLSRFAPWSVLACIGFWHVCYRPSAESVVRRFERFLFCYFGVGMLVFSVAAVHRADHLFPLLPAAALLAGREIARIISSERQAALPVRVVSVATAALAIIGYYYLVPRADQPMVVRTRQMQQFAQVLERQIGNQFPLVHMDSPFALQFYMNTMHRRVSPSQAARILAGDYDAFVIVRDSSKMTAFLDPAMSRLHEVARWPQTGEAYVRILSNHPRLEYTHRMATFAGPIHIRMEGVQIVGSRNDQLAFESRAPVGIIKLTNESLVSRAVSVQVDNSLPSRGVLAAGATWHLTAVASEKDSYSDLSLSLPRGLMILTSSSMSLPPCTVTARTKPTPAQ